MRGGLGLLGIHYDVVLRLQSDLSAKKALIYSLTLESRALYLVISLTHSDRNLLWLLLNSVCLLKDDISKLIH